MNTTYLYIGIIIGGSIAYIIAFLFNKTKSVSKNEFQILQNKHNDSLTQIRILEERVTTLQSTNEKNSQNNQEREKEILQLRNQSVSLDTQLSHKEERVSELTQQLLSTQLTLQTQQNEINLHKQKIAELLAQNNSLEANAEKINSANEQQTRHIGELNTRVNTLTAEKSELISGNTYLTEKLSTQKTEIEELQNRAHLQFEKIANSLLEEKSSKFTEANKANLEALLNPLKEDINKFKTKVEETYDKESKERFSLEASVIKLIEQTNKVSAEANNLATALKGKPQKRGNWGEMILESILEASGLTKDREYFVQQSIKDEDGNHLRPDVRISLPDERMIIIDSKVSLIAYDKLSATEDAEEQKIYIKEHLSATYDHINQLSAKNYDHLESSLDFTMMFIPIEPAYLIAIQSDTNLWAYAYSKRILLVSPTNLIACLKLISDLWRREWQNKNAMEIVKKGETLYDKFVGFTATFEGIGKDLKSAQEKYDKALGQFKEGRGNLVTQAIQLKNLGLKSDKKIPSNMLPLDIENNEQETPDE